MKLLIVDDDMWLCSALARGLVKLGHFARTATSVEMAIDLIAHEAPSAILTDLDLGPGGNGVDLITRLRAAGSTIPTFLMPGSDPVIARSRLAAAGLESIAIFEKPFAFEDLMSRLTALVPDGSRVASEPARPTPPTA